MIRLSSAARHLPGVTTLRKITILSLTAVLASVGIAAPASASAEHFIAMRGTAKCDADAQQWVITWTLTNESDVAGTIGNVRVYPPDRALVGMPSRVQPGETVTGVQRTLASEYTAQLILDVNWDDGPVTYNHHWPTYIKMFCAPA
jgi:hypothetical protein